MLSIVSVDMLSLMTSVCLLEIKLSYAEHTPPPQLPHTQRHVLFLVTAKKEMSL